jgi:hypothetical protein
MMYMSTSGACFLEPSYFPLPGSVFESLRMVGSLVAPVLSAVSKALVISTRLRWLIVRWVSLHSSLLESFESCFSPLLRAILKLLAVTGGFEALTVLLTAKPGVVLSCDFGCPFLRCRWQSSVYAELVPRVLALWIFGLALVSGR